MSKCKRPNLPAFSLETVHEANKSCTEEGQRNAHDAEKMSQILPYVMLGSWRDAEDGERVLACGITHVLNVAKEIPPAVEQACMDAIKSVAKKQISLADAHSENILECFEEAFAFIDEARRAGGRVLVHCRRGISRSPAIVIGYIMYQTHSSYRAALTYVKERRTSVSLNLAFQSLLEDYHPGSPRPDHELERLILGAAREEISLRPPLHGRTPSSCSASDQCAGQTDCSDSCDSNYSARVKPLPPSPDVFGKRTSSFLDDGFST